MTLNYLRAVQHVFSDPQVSTETLGVAYGLNDINQFSDTLTIQSSHRCSPDSGFLPCVNFESGSILNSLEVSTHITPLYLKVLL